MKQNVFWITLLSITSSQICMEKENLPQIYEHEIYEFEEFDIKAVYASLQDKLLGKEVPRWILKRYNVVFGPRRDLPNSGVDFHDKELVIFITDDNLLANGLNKPLYGRVKADKQDILVAYLSEHNIPKYKIRVDAQTTRFILCEKDDLHKLPLQLKHNFNEAH